jgi:hypothetical protein
MRKIRLPCYGTVTGTSNSVGADWFGFCETCGQQVTVPGFGVAAPHFREMIVPDEVAEAFVAIGGEVVLLKDDLS